MWKWECAGLGQIDYLAEIAEPTIGVITNIGSAHVELLGSIQNIARAKAELFARLPQKADCDYAAQHSLSADYKTRPTTRLPPYSNRRPGSRRGNKTYAQ